MEINIGDIVQLISGGPEMSVHDIFGKTTTKQFTLAYKTAGHTDGEIICKWFSGSKLETGFFKIETLKKIR
ncbi:YodC family protein [Flavobacterium sp. I3-2]|uniref:YodC family protein n=1 Tax=Flavobacterium sp. I3-2 TaxID=2748319 RepID=UPI001C4A174C|nr:DUF2158 domain-containing protein [Flavobacterium sp. I3-2]